MKTKIVLIMSVCLIGAGAYVLGRKSQPAAVNSPTVQPMTTESRESQAPAEPVPAPEPKPRRNPESTDVQPAPAPVPDSPAPSAPARREVFVGFNQAVESLVSPRASFAQKQAAWQQVRDAGKLDPLITELEQRAVATPNATEYPATLGQAYLQKAGTLTDIREQGILGMKADQSFDAALNLDPDNWEARFWKATAMSYWPPQLNKTKEVIERFLDLVRLQETQAPQPQFAQTYVLLGEQYQKQGYPDYAKQVWQRGASLFPSDSKLVQKLSSPQPAEQALAR